MAPYVKQTWIARVRQYLNRITLALVSGSTYDVTQVEGTVSVDGTPTSVARLNYMEEGIYQASIRSQSADSADTAVKLTTSRTIALSGDVTGSVSFDGTANVTITAVVVDDSHNHIISNVGGLQTALDNKASLTTAVVDLTVSQSLAAGATANFSIPIGASNFTHFEGLVIRSGNQVGSAVLIRKTPTDDYVIGMTLGTAPAVWSSKIAGVVTASVGVPFAGQQLGYRVLDSSHYAKIVSITFSGTNIVFQIKNDNATTAAALSFRIMGEVGYK